MKSARQIFLGATLAAAVMTVATSTLAQIQTTGKLGSPGATTTIDGKQIPPPPMPFGGVINVPFRHGSIDVVKQSATPSADNSAHPLQRSNTNGLQDELIRHLNDDTKTSSFDFGLQFLDAERMTYWGKHLDANFWIENASVEWNEAEAPFHTVARLTLLQKSHLPPDAGEATYFDVTGNAAPDSTPVGSINRARRQGELASRKARMSARGNAAQLQESPRNNGASG